MAITNHDRVTRAMDLLRQGLAPYVVREFKNLYKDRASEEARRFVFNEPSLERKELVDWDVSALLKLMWEAWNEVFKRTLGFAERSLVSELRDWRNKWAHQEPFSSDDADRTIDSIGRLLTAVSAPQVDEVQKLKLELRRLVYDEQVRSEKRKAGGSLVEAATSGTLKPWREVVTPHSDVASGRYQQAEFAADLWQVHIGEGTAEYHNPTEFFRRTFMTDSLKLLLNTAVQRLSGKGGDPVVQLQTNFGGGKTHSMLALYHLFSGTHPSELPGIDMLMADTGITVLPKVKRIVLVGNRISPGNPVIKSDGTIVRTLWGELAWQLGGQDAFGRIAMDDERSTSPGDALRELFIEFGPCLILIDEWVAYARQLHDQSDLPAGSFETQFTFAQVLTESVKLAKNCMVVISLPASDTSGSPHIQADDVEVGGIRGREALDRLRNVVGRVESSWRPATAEEGFEIVRRRLFEPLSGEAYKYRDVTARAFADLYRTQSGEFPLECRDADYEKRIKAAYPIHPEIFDRLYSDWSTLVKFQRTRGVLRLMAAVIHCLWEKGDRNPLILPSTIPIDDGRVQTELTRYLSDNWAPIIEKDVDGPNSLPMKIDAEVSNLGKLYATRRVARTIYLGSAPVATASHRGLEDRRVKLGCVMPGESPAVFGDAMRRLASSATYLYQDGPRFWYATQPTVTKLAEDRAEQLKRDPDKVAGEMEARLRNEMKSMGDFLRIHTLPRTGADVPDDMDSRLVVLHPDYPYSKEQDSPAINVAQTILESRGSVPRLFRNTLVFMAADKIRLQDLDEAIRRFLAWSSILIEKEQLNLDPFQVRQAETQKRSADSMVAARLPETYQWLLVPEQKTPYAEIEWIILRLSGTEPLAVRAAKRLRSEELLVASLGSTVLRRHMDEVPLWRGNHVQIRQLADDFARYLYLSRITSPRVLVKAISDGLLLLTWQKDTFSLAESFDDQEIRYRGLSVGKTITILPESVSLLVKPEIALKQMEAEVSPPVGKEIDTGGVTINSDGDTQFEDERIIGDKPPVKPLLPRRYHGTVSLDPTRVGRDASRIADEVIAHLSGLVGSEVKISLEINAEVSSGIPERIIRIVTENGNTLKFSNQGFENE